LVREIFTAASPHNEGARQMTELAANEIEWRMHKLESSLREALRIYRDVAELAPSLMPHTIRGAIFDAEKLLGESKSDDARSLGVEVAQP
jgi:hypothetical protein